MSYINANYLGKQNNVNNHYSNNGISLNNGTNSNNINGSINGVISQNNSNNTKDYDQKLQKMYNKYCSVLASTSYT